MDDNAKVQKIIGQTDYTEIQALEKLKECDGDEIRVIKQYLGINIQPKKEMKSINQEIYTQLRHKLYITDIEKVQGQTKKCK